MNPDIRKCNRCGKLYMFVNSPNCVMCNDEIEESFKKVRDFLFDNEHATIAEVVEGTEVEEELIISFLREGRLISADPSFGLVCDKCGKLIKGGRMCEDCLNNLHSTLHAAFNDMAGTQESNQPKEKRQGSKTSHMHINMN